MGELALLEDGVDGEVLEEVARHLVQLGLAGRGDDHAEVQRVALELRLDGERLHLSVSDDGLAGALQGNGFPREGVGLTNTRERLRERYVTTAAMGRSLFETVALGPDGEVVAQSTLAGNSAVTAPAILNTLSA